MTAAGQDVVLPPVPAQYLIDWWLEIGPTSAGGMGEAPLAWLELVAWQGLTGIEFEPWEARAIRRMSAAFLSQQQAAREPGCPAPYSTETAAQAAARLDSQFAALADWAKRLNADGSAPALDVGSASAATSATAGASATAPNHPTTKD